VVSSTPLVPRVPVVSDPVRFTLNGRSIAADVPPTTTLLDWLRARPGFTGTKEGCAEGDCGACSVAIADPSSPDGNPTWRAVNSCLVLMPMVHGRTVVTVEGLKRGSTPHPVQDALVIGLGSQCGYCTPGIAMSLFEAAHRRDLAGEPAKIDDQLCGNLCRCTGYRPIRDAATLVAGTCPADGHVLDGIAGVQPLTTATGTQRWFTPATFDALWDALDANPDAKLICGGTDLSLDVTKKHAVLPCLVSVEALGMRESTRIDGGWRIGANVLLSDLEAHASDHIRPMARMLRFFASRQIKNRATIGGNVCNASPIGDTPPVLLGLGATAVIRGRAGERRVPFDRFFLAYRKTALAKGEILVAVEIPDLPDDALAASYKVSKRRELDISAVCGCFVVRVAGGVVTSARLAYGGMAATPSLAAGAAAALVGQPWGEPAIEAAMSALDHDFTPIDDHRASAWYRATVARNLLRGFWLETKANPIPALSARPSATVLAEGA
jgi:xanthine dehydrogenase small subunit